MSNSLQEANQEGHYKFLVVAIVVGLIGVYVRFAPIPHASAIANIILVIGVILGLKGVFKIIE